MKRAFYLICTTMMLFNSVIAVAQQQAYPEDMLNIEDHYLTPVKFKGASPSIVDFVTSLLNDEGAMLMDSGNFFDAWDHYLRHEKQEPGSEIIVDEKNGYVCMTYTYQDEYEGETSEEKGAYEMCYWNCADGKHKLFALNFNAMTNGRYFDGQTTGLSINLYENARHIMWDVNEDLLGLAVDPGTDENYESDPKTGLHLVRDRETGEPLALNEEDFYRWLEEKPVVVYRLPRQGKDIIAEIHYATRTDTIRFVWDGMRFNRE